MILFALRVAPYHTCLDKLTLLCSRKTVLVSRGVQDADVSISSFFCCPAVSCATAGLAEAE